MNIDRDYDYLDLDDDSDHEKAESSEDELDIILHGASNQKQKVRLHYWSTSSHDSSSESDFEKEMNDELNKKVEALEAARKTPVKKSRNSDEATASCSSSTECDKMSIDTGQGTSSSTGKTTKAEFYDDVYFDSDEEEMVTQGNNRAKKRRKHPVVSNDDLLFDPDIDDDDQRWVDRHRRSYLPKRKENKVKPLPRSDAVLNCPACMTTLCLDCQRHELYSNQYRAMFVMNCRVDTSELLSYPTKQKQRTKTKKKKGKTTEPPGGEECQSTDTCGSEVDVDKLNPVKCTECNTVVAVYDKEEVYHFFNVLSSY